MKNHGNMMCGSLLILQSQTFLSGVFRGLGRITQSRNGEVAIAQIARKMGTECRSWGRQIRPTRKLLWSDAVDLRD